MVEGSPPDASSPAILDSRGQQASSVAMPQDVAAMRAELRELYTQLAAKQLEMLEGKIQSKGKPQAKYRLPAARAWRN